jgi:hypothetical protein
MNRNLLLRYFCLRLTAQAAVAGVWFAIGVLIPAQEAKSGDSPLDTLMHTKLWADVPEAKDFVRESRPAPESLGYQPVTGTDPPRPKLRSRSELKALEGELENAAAHNVANARKRLGVMKSTPAKTAIRE